MHWPVLVEGREADGEVETPLVKKMAAQMGEMGKGVPKSWANIAAGVRVTGQSPSLASSARVLTPSNDSGVLEAKSSSDDDEQEVADSDTEDSGSDTEVPGSDNEDPGPNVPAYQPSRYTPPLIGGATPRPPVKPGFWFPPVSGLDHSSPTAAAPTASNLALPTWSSHLPSSGVRPPPGFPQLPPGLRPPPGFPQLPSGLRPPPGFPPLPAHTAGESQAGSTFGGRTEGLGMPVDTTAYIRERHCAGCSFCDWLKSRRVYE